MLVEKIILIRNLWPILFYNSKKYNV